MKKLFRILGKKGRITIPFEIRQKLNLGYNDILSFTESGDGRTVIVKREKICEDCVDRCIKNDATDKVTLLDFLNGLSKEQQRAALVHLSVLWAEQEDKMNANKNISN